MKNEIKVVEQKGDFIKDAIYFIIALLGLCYIVLVTLFGFDGNDGFAKVLGLDMPKTFEKHWGLLMSYLPFAIISLLGIVSFSGRLRKVVFLIILIMMLVLFGLMKAGLLGK